MVGVVGSNPIAPTKYQSHEHKVDIMPVITLPDQSQKQFETAVTVSEVALSIGKGLARAAIAGKVDGNLVDLSFALQEDASVAIVTNKDPEGLEIVRHSTAHLLAHAVKELFPDSQVTIGPVIDDGFYYDFSYTRAFTPDDLEAIENKMLEIAKRKYEVKRVEMERDKAVSLFQEQGELYKAEIIASIPESESISLYRQGEFTDLCRGPHVPNTDKLKVFKILKLSGAYWRGDSNNEMLQRIYGTAWNTKDELSDYIYRIEQAEKRDHRKLGKQLNYFHFQDDAPGMAFWHPYGQTIWQQVEDYMRNVYKNNGYQEVKCPSILDVSLWKKSGHWDNFRDNMFFTDSENREYAVKPMNCPGHVQIYNNKLRSYRDLPLRFGEFGSCHRNEPSGALHGLMRVRAFTQDDGHIFCMSDQIKSEVINFHNLALKVYSDFGFKEVAVKLALRPEKRLGTDELWSNAEESLRAALGSCSVDWTELPGEGAFYGPKIEYHLTDSIGRSWQCGTVQVDFMMPERLQAQYVAENNSRETPVMLHRAILGSLERFIGIVIENCAGALPLWLSPVQIAVMNISDSQVNFVKKINKQLTKAGFRATSDLRNEKITYKIREHSVQRVPYLLIVGDKEVENNKVSVRARGAGDIGQVGFDELVEKLQLEIARFD